MCPCVVNSCDVYAMTYVIVVFQIMKQVLDTFAFSNQRNCLYILSTSVHHITQKAIFEYATQDIEGHRKIMEYTSQDFRICNARY